MSSTAPATSTARIRHRRRSNEVPPEASKENGGHLLVNDQNKYRSMIIRAYSSVWMIGGFAFIIYMGHLYIGPWLSLSKSLWQENCSVYSGDLMKIGNSQDSGY
ncbi:hypothetical protein L1049_010298 [Liquidambar formosana]|uniref:phosphatidate cytidylyltransferase n=1 Tax=Liquidambar formosana TaxID=63359 RepID=A0AAP0N9K6_LIQFO